MSTSLTANPPRRQRTAWEIQRAVLFALFVREVRANMKGRRSGLAWMVVEPVGQVLLIVTFFSFLRHLSSPYMDLPIFLVSGMLPFFLFRNLYQQLATSIENNRALFAYRQVKPLDAVVARAVVETTIWLAVAVITLLLLGWFGYQALPQRPLELIGVVAVVALLGGGLGLLLSVVTFGQPRLRWLTRILSMPLYFTSGIIFSVERLPKAAQDWLVWNPLLHIVELSRRGFAPSHPSIEGIGFGYPLTVALVIMALGLAVYRRDRQKLLLGR